MSAVPTSLATQGRASNLASVQSDAQVTLAPNEILTICISTQAGNPSAPNVTGVTFNGNACTQVAYAATGGVTQGDWHGGGIYSFQNGIGSNITGFIVGTLSGSNKELRLAVYKSSGQKLTGGSYQAVTGANIQNTANGTTDPSSIALSSDIDDVMFYLDMASYQAATTVNHGSGQLGVVEYDQNNEYFGAGYKTATSTVVSASIEHGSTQGYKRVAVVLRTATPGTILPPNPPTSLTVDAVGPTTATIGLVLPTEGRTSMELQYRLVGGSTWTSVTGTANQTAWPLTGLTANTPYEVQARCINSLASPTQSAWYPVAPLQFGTENPATGGGEISATIITPQVFNINEGVSVVGRLQAALGGTLTWSIVGGPDAADFSLVAVGNDRDIVPTGLLDFEYPGDANGDNVYTFDVRVDNGTANYTSTITVTVANVFEAINFTGASSGYQGATISPVVVNEAGAPVAGVALAWVGTSGGTISGVTNGSGQASIALSATPGTYTLRATIGSLTTDRTITVNAYPALNSVTFSPALAGNAGGSSAVTVTVLDVAGNPAANATVVLTSQTGGIISSTSGTTNSSGQAVLTVSYLAQGFTYASFQATRFASVKESALVTVFVQPVVTLSQVPEIAAQETEPKFEEEVFPYVFDFSPQLGEDETILEVVSVTCVSTPASFDTNSAAMLLGTPVIHGQKVVHFIGSGKKGGAYVIRITVRSTRSKATAEIKLRVFAVVGRRV